MFVFNRETLNTLAEAIRSNDVASNNSATKWARYTLNALRNDASVTYAVIEAATVNSFKVKGVNGKQATVGGLRKAGFSAMAKRLTDVKFIAEQINVSGVDVLIDAFVASDKDKDSFNALNLAIRAAVTAAGSVESDAVEPTQEQAETPAPAPAPAPAPLSLADTIAEMEKFIRDMTVEQIAECSPQLASLYDTIADAWENANVEVKQAA